MPNQKEKEPATAGTATSSNTKSIYQYDSIDTLICQALKLGRIACEIGAEVEYQDGVFILTPQKVGEQ